MRGTRDIDKKAAAVTEAYRAWRSPKTAAKRQADYEQRKRVQEANIIAKRELAKGRR
jgi:hypothetical protein